MRKTIFLMALMLCVSAVFAFASGNVETNKFYDLKTGQPIANVQSIVYTCTDSTCSAPQGSEWHNQNSGGSNVAVVTYPNTPTKTHYAEFFQASCYVPMAYNSFSWGTGLTFNYDVNFYKEPLCTSLIDTFSVTNEVYPNQPVMIDVQTNFDAKAHSAFTLIDDHVKFVAGDMDLYSAKTKVTLRIYNDQNTLIFTDSKIVNIFVDTAENVHFEATPTEPGVYTAEVTTEVIDCQCEDTKPQTATKTFRVIPQGKTEYCYTQLNDLSINNDIPEPGEDLIITANKISNSVNTFGKLTALPTDVSVKVYADNVLVYSNSKQVPANPDVVNPVSFSFDAGSLQDADYYIVMDAVAANCPYSDNELQTETLNFLSNPVQFCGNGIVESPEQCDDNNLNNNDGCSSTCEIEFCGDGIKQSNEACDDGNNNAGDGCSATCEAEQCQTDADCNDGLFCNGQEVCNGNYLCESGSPVVCDNGFFCDGVESCNENTDSCVATGNPCTAGESCNENNDVCEHIPFCGDGIKQSNEACDDGNNQAGDGCSATCEIEECSTDFDCQDGLFCNGQEICDTATYTCKPGSDPCGSGETCNEHFDSCEKIPVCGDGVLDSVEQCDDGNNVNGDYCSSTCTIQQCAIDSDCNDGLFCNGQEVCNTVTYTCQPGNNPCNSGETCNESFDVCEKIPVCGDSVIDAGETCDDGNRNNNDGCSSVCAVEFCGDGVKQSNEACDDGNNQAGDGCSATCTVEQCQTDADCSDGLFCNGQEVCNSNYVCESGSPVVCDNGLFCDGVESCNEATDSCTAGAPVVCDNGLFCDGVESCNENTDSCDAGTPIVCNDGQFCNGFESCDESIDSCVTTGNPCTAGESCNENIDVCEKIPVCGDFVIDAGETCDDGNLNSNDGCSATCQIEFCGDGIKQSNEVCDDGNTVSGDGCSATCQIIEQCQTNADCNDGLFCNGQEVCNGNYLCESGSPIVCDNGLFCDGVESCNEATDSCAAGTPVVCDNGLFCDGVESCNENTDSCDAGTPIVCDNGIFCDGAEVCNEATNSCDSGTPVNCGPGQTCSTQKDACVLDPFAARIFATPTKGSPTLTSDVRADTTGCFAPFTYEWDFDEDGVIDFTGKKTKLQFDKEGTYTLFLRVTCGDGRVSTDTEIITVREIQDRRQIIHINGIRFEKEFYKPGETVTAFVNFENIGDKELRGTRVAAMIPELGVRSNYVKPTAFDIGHQSSKALHVELPEWTPAGDHWVMFIIDIDGDRRIKYRPITVI